MTGATGSSIDLVILVVEDEFIIHMLVIDILIDAGFLVIEAQHADHVSVQINHYFVLHKICGNRSRFIATMVSGVVTFEG